MIIRDENLIGQEPPAGLVSGAAEEFCSGLPRLERLRRYYLGKHDVLSRSRADSLPNIRLAHGYPRYIAQVSAGWLLGEPVRYEAADGDEGLDAFLKLCESCEAQRLDSRLAQQQAIYGRAVSLCYRGEGGAARAAALDPLSAFVVYDDTVEHRPLFGVLLQEMGAPQPGGKARRLLVYTAERVLRYEDDGAGRLSGPLEKGLHPFGRVPMVEYFNDLEAHGDFEDVMPLIDAYDLLSSDRLNDRAQFADALLVLTGVMGIGTAESPTDRRLAAQRLREDRTLSLPDADARAEWLLKNPVEEDIDVLRRALAQDIHKFSMTPDFLDERFAGNLSGVAIKYKLFCLEQKTRLKEQWFAGGLRERARLLCNCLRAAGQPAPDAERLRILFTRHLPESDLERAQTIKALDGVVPARALRAHFPLASQNK